MVFRLVTRLPVAVRARQIVRTAEDILDLAEEVDIGRDHVRGPADLDHDPARTRPRRLLAGGYGDLAVDEDPVRAGGRRLAPLPRAPLTS